MASNIYSKCYHVRNSRDKVHKIDVKTPSTPCIDLLGELGKICDTEGGNLATV